MPKGTPLALNGHLSRNLWRLVSLTTFIIAGTAGWHMSGTVALYALPVAAAAFADGWRGGTIVAVFSSAAVLVAPGEPTLPMQILSAIALLSLGIMAGIWSDREQQKRSELQKRTEQLSSIYEKVQANFEGMKRVERLSAIGQLSAGLAHEIRNPLASISGAAAILSRSDNLDGKSARCVNIIASESQRLDGLLTNFLNFARPRPPRLQTIQLTPLFDNILELVSHRVRGDAVHCEMTIESQLPAVECDPEQLEQVLLNLMINAIEASPKGGKVVLSAGVENHMVAIRVVDHGHGVSPAHLDRLFDPFFTTKEHGTGLGLPVAHQIMTQMGGRLVAERNHDHGMTFSVILPAHQAVE